MKLTLIIAVMLCSINSRVAAQVGIKSPPPPNLNPSRHLLTLFDNNLSSTRVAAIPQERVAVKLPQCPMPIFKPDTTKQDRMPISRPDTTRVERMPTMTGHCVNLFWEPGKPF